MSAAWEIEVNLSPRQRAAIIEGNDEYLSDGTDQVTWLALRDLGLTFRDGSMKLTKKGKSVPFIAVRHLAPNQDA